MSDLKYFDIKDSDRVRTTVENKKFYKTIVEEKKIFSNMHQLFTYAFLVAIHQGLEPCKETKSEEVCHVSNINADNFNIVKGIGVMVCDAEDGNALLKQIIELADAGIKHLVIEYQNNGMLRLDKYLD